MSLARVYICFITQLPLSFSPDRLSSLLRTAQYIIASSLQVLINRLSFCPLKKYLHILQISCRLSLLCFLVHFHSKSGNLQEVFLFLPLQCVISGGRLGSSCLCFRYWQFRHVLLTSSFTECASPSGSIFGTRSCDAIVIFNIFSRVFAITITVLLSA